MSMNMNPEAAFAAAERRDRRHHPFRAILARLVLLREA
jgi:hypothetical protein